MTTQTATMKTTLTRTPTKLGQLVRVDWRDSVSGNGWEYVKRGSNVLAPCPLIHTVGWIVGWKAGIVTIASTKGAMSDDDREGHLQPLSIPRGCIERIVKL